MGAVEVYRKTQKPTDIFWNKYVCRPVAAAIVHAIAGTRITPNQVTLAAFVVACGAAVMMITLPGYWGLLVAVIVYELSYVLDCVDGMLARWRGTASPTGHLLDFLMDEIKAFMILAAASVRLYLDHADVRYLLVGLGGLTCLASGIAITTFLRRPEVAGDGAGSGSATASKPSLLKRAVGLVESGAKFLIHYPSYILYTAIAGRLEIYFFAYVAVNAVYVLRVLAQVTLRFGRQ